MRDDNAVAASYFHLFALAWNNVVHADLHRRGRATCDVPAPGKFVFLPAQGTTVFRAATPAFCTISVRHKKQRPPKSTLSRAEKISGLRRVLKKHVAQAEHVEFVDEPEGVEVRPSLIEGAGSGLFTTRKFRKGEVLCTYYGVKKSLFQLLRSDNTDYMVGGFGLNCWLDAADQPRVLARYINDNKDTTKICVRFVKCKEVPGPGGAPAHARIEALRDLKAGEEVYVSYGEVFWRVKGGMK